MAVAQRGGPQKIPRPELTRVGEPPSWLDYSGPKSIDEIRSTLGSYTPSEVVRGPAVSKPAELGRKSAVLVAMFDGADGPATILTRRPLHMRKHAGEVAFPGGSHDDEDATLWDTALREAHEEVGLDPSLPVRAGDLDSFVTGASYSLVQPIVATLKDIPRLVASPDEVDVILTVPIRELVSAGVYRCEDWFWEGTWVPMHFFELVGDTVWGATALMLHNLLETLASAQQR